MEWKDRIISDPEIMLGKPVIKGTRLTVQFLIEQLANGWTEADIIESYSGLTHEDIQACFSFVAETLNDVKIFSIPA
jgi:uncharacterized protein (DUF433 family)